MDAQVHAQSAAHANRAVVQQLKQFYEHFSVGTIARLDEVYTPDVEFRDPVHNLRGSLALRNYLRGMATNLQSYRIHYVDELIGDNSAWLSWEMDYAHKHLRAGREITLRGMTHVRFTTKVFYHEDSYDLGALVYEHVPGIGIAVRRLKQRLAQKD